MKPDRTSVKLRIVQRRTFASRVAEMSQFQCLMAGAGLNYPIGRADDTRRRSSAKLFKHLP
jgi:hypothetical protein